MPIRRANHPYLYLLSVELHRLQRWLLMLLQRHNLARKRDFPQTPVKIFQHRSVLIRKLGVSDPQLQINKITNLKLAAKAIDETVIRPGETFSLWYLVGRPNARRGFVPGMLLSQGEVVSGVGGGLCQMSNLLYWIFLHSPLTVTESHRHGHDVFPDSGRVLPFGSGATVFYNYVDLQAVNQTKLTFRIRVWVGDKFLFGELFADSDSPYRYHVVEQGHKFIPLPTGGWMRENKLRRITIETKTGLVLNDVEFRHNLAEVMYEPRLDN